jgi:hypothetical protein
MSLKNASKFIEESVGDEDSGPRISNIYDYKVTAYSFLMVCLKPNTKPHWKPDIDFSKITLHSKYGVQCSSNQRPHQCRLGDEQMSRRGGGTGPPL